MGESNPKNELKFKSIKVASFNDALTVLQLQ